MRTVSRVADLIEQFDHLNPSRDLRELIEASGLPKSTVLRLATDLVNRGMLSLNSKGFYSIGPAFLRWTQLAQDMWHVDEETMEILESLVRDLGETATLYVRQGGSRTAIASVDGTHAIRNVVKLGELLPLTRGASAMALLSGNLNLIDSLKASARQGDGEDFDEEQLRRRAEQVAELGYCESQGEREADAASIAVPVRNQDGRVIAALSISGPISRFGSGVREKALARMTDASKILSTNGIGPVGGLL
ncbi:IclR family transcriptional regulator [Corynebacterium sp. A21]|uniref:IclR family transcriptional regulator n=1 Tax=Corynebacterium sp. A21 TaxID=3457318 RepID=UPI003FD54EA1